LGRSSTAPGASRQLLGVQYLRAIAALMVACYHMQIQLPGYAPYLRQWWTGGAHLANGVDLFFVISGFIMLVTSQRSTPADFARRRIMRVVPLYWVLTAVLAVLAYLRPELFRTTVLGLEFLLKSLFFIPYANPGQGGEFVPLLVPGWTLNLEMFFYAIFALVLFVPLNRRVALTGTIFLAVVLAGQLLRHSAYGGLIGCFASMRLFEFLSGMAIGQWYLRGELPKSMPACAGLVVLGFALLLAGIPGATFEPGSGPQMLAENVLPAALIVLGAVSLEQARGVPVFRPLAFLGDASYSMYLSHIFTLGAARFLWSKTVFQAPSAMHALGFACFAIALVVLASAGVYRLVEQPISRLLQGWQRIRAPGTRPLAVQPVP
jgi:exopolysaccharide production protein ExoZ